MTQHYQLKSYHVLSIYCMPGATFSLSLSLPYLILTINPEWDHYYLQFTHRQIAAQTLDYILQLPLQFEVAI